MPLATADSPAGRSFAALPPDCLSFSLTLIGLLEEAVGSRLSLLGGTAVVLELEAYTQRDELDSLTERVRDAHFGHAGVKL